MAVSTFKGTGAAGGGNDLGGTVVTSSAVNGTGVINENIAAGTYVFSFNGASGSGSPAIEATINGENVDLGSVALASDWTSNQIVTLPGDATKIWIYGFKGVVTISTFAVANSVFLGLGSPQSVPGYYMDAWRIPYATWDPVIETTDHVFFTQHDSVNSNVAIHAIRKSDGLIYYPLTTGNNVWTQGAHCTHSTYAVSDATLMHGTNSQRQGPYICYRTPGEDNYAFASAPNVMPSSGFVSCAYSPDLNRFIVTNHNQTTTWYSDDEGVTWTQSNNTTVGTIYRLHWENGKFFAFRNGSYSVFSHSDDGVNWTTAALPNGSDSFRQPKWNGSVWLTNSFNRAAVYSSTDLTTWTTHALSWSSVNAYSSPISILPSGRAVVMANEMTSSNAGAWSDDGVTWNYFPYVYGKTWMYSNDTYTRLFGIPWTDGNIYYSSGSSITPGSVYKSAENDIWFNGVGTQSAHNAGGYSRKHTHCQDPTGQYVINPASGPYSLGMASQDNGKTYQWVNPYNYINQASAWINGKFFMCTNQTSTVFTATPNPNGTWTTGSIGGDGRTCTMIATDGVKYAVFNNESTSYTARYTANGGASMSSTGITGVFAVARIGQTSKFLMSRSGGNWAIFDCEGGSLDTTTPNFTGGPYYQAATDGGAYQYFSGDSSTGTVNIVVFRDGVYQKSAVFANPLNGYAKIVAFKGKLFILCQNLYGEVGAWVSEDNGDSFYQATDFNFPQYGWLQSQKEISTSIQGQHSYGIYDIANYLAPSGLIQANVGYLSGGTYDMDSGWTNQTDYRTSSQKALSFAVTEVVN